MLVHVKLYFVLWICRPKGLLLSDLTILGHFKVVGISSVLGRKQFYDTIMSTMAWNVRGLGNKEMIRAIRNATLRFKPSLIFLSETKKKKRYWEKINMKLKMRESFYVDPIGIAGGLALWWTEDVNLSILKVGKYFTDAKISIEGEEQWFVTFIYGPPYGDGKEEFWSSLSSLRELPIKGGTFTWSNLRSEDEAMLDRVIVSLEWSTDFPNAIGVLDMALASNLAPIFLLLKGLNKKYKRDFKFEEKWLLEEDCLVNVQESWRPMNVNSSNLVFGKKLSRTRSRLKQWSKLKFKKNRKREDELKDKIKLCRGNI
ncbi:hypothetical protein V6N12_046083 [Hibiscus sabdariffa]|uniref:Uncharacterized protein n=1 Tax=Hibiscus sabdariffa TaxID=183260 RepID=A0ABR2G5R3_9ROSI